MNIWPAIDIRHGRCVRLRQGDFSKETAYGDPLEVAAHYVEEGAERLHVVDLDAARSGRPVNRATVVEIARATGVVVEAGGGVRDEQSASFLLKGGIERVVLGTAALRDHGLLERLTARWPGRVVVGLDYLAGREVALEGWTEKSGVLLAEALRRLDGLELGGVVVTAIVRDGTGKGPDLAVYGELLDKSELPLVASGGIATLSDIESLSALEKKGRRLSGVVVGRALLSGELSLKDASAASSREAR